MKIELESNIFLEQLSTSHAPAIFALTDANRSFLRAWLPWLDGVISVNDTAKFIQNSIEKFESGQGPNFVVLYNNSLCGMAGFHDINLQSNIGSIGYWLAEAHTGLGIMSKVVAQLLRIGFSEYDLNKIEIRCATNNIKGCNTRSSPDRKWPVGDRWFL